MKAFLFAVVTFFVAMFCLSMLLPFPLPLFLAIVCAVLVWKSLRAKT